MKNIFNLNDTTEIIGRINKLQPTSQGQWGKMDVSQMLAHCNVTYELIYDSKHPKPNAIKVFLLKLLVKSIVVNDKPYKKNSRTGPVFLIAGERDFETEKNRLIVYINKTQELGENHFHDKESYSFGKLTKEEWNNMLYKHVNHHLEQFGV